MLVRFGVKLLLAAIVLVVASGKLQAGQWPFSTFTKPIGIDEFRWIRKPKKDKTPRKKSECQLLAEELGAKSLAALQCRAAYHDVGAMYEIGLLHEEGKVDGATMVNAVGFYELAGGALDGPICEDKAATFISQTDKRSCLPFIEYGAPIAQYRLGLLYADGKKIGRDLTLSRFWFNAAKERGLKEAEKAIVALDDLERRIAARQAEQQAQ